MLPPERFAVLAIPLNRPDVRRFLYSASTEPRGAPLYILGQRPTEPAEQRWLERLASSPAPTVNELLAIDDPRAHLVQTWTDRLVPAEFLDEREFLTRNLGGWTPIYFAVVGLASERPDDPLLQQAEVLTNYGDTIRAFGAEPQQVERRLSEEVGLGPAEAADSLIDLHRVQEQMQGDRVARIEYLYAALAGGESPAAPRLLLCDALMGELVRLEVARRQLVANGKPAAAERIERQQQMWRDEYGLHLILKGEYIAGRHRRSTIVIAPELGVVIKQPAPEPFHEIVLGAKVYEGKPENWPRTTRDGAVVTPRGRLRLVLEENVVPRLNRALGHGVRFSSLLGLIVEDFVTGPTVQEYVLADPDRLTAALYEKIVVTQQVCEVLGVENGDWHSANFIMKGDGSLVHIDWGAARPLRDDELTPAGRRARLNQVKNIAFSFHDDGIAAAVKRLHNRLVGDDAWLARVRRQAREYAGKA